MMRFDEKSSNFCCTEIGRIASHFYIQCSSVETYNEMLRRHMNETEARLICNGIRSFSKGHSNNSSEIELWDWKHTVYKQKKYDTCSLSGDSFLAKFRALDLSNL
ncbi:hypothetical protein ACE6H2_005966 [Prunus campanulata]